MIVITKNIDEYYMQQALTLAKKGRGFVKTNPLVGCVIVRDGIVLATGYHHRYGDLHAERDALDNARGDVKGATAYVTLEPCCHQGKQPPCTDALIEAGIKKVVVATGDPNPKVAGVGLQILKDAGIEVVVGVLEEEAQVLNDVFFYFMVTGQPWLALKYAMTLDGKIATSTGASQWITGKLARDHIHQLRHEYTAIMVGIGTALVDDPLLTARFEGAVNPIRIVVDSNLSLSLDSQLVNTANEVPLIVATISQNQTKIADLEALGVDVLRLAANNEQVDLRDLLKTLGKRKINSILVEGGAGLNGSLVRQGLVNKVYTYIAPKIFGGQTALSPVSDAGISLPSEALNLKVNQISYFGQDILIESEVV